MPTSQLHNDNVIKPNGFMEVGSYENLGVMRQYVNPAIYVENDVYELQKQPVLLKYSCHELHVPKILKVKKCTCAMDEKSCACHPYEEDKSQSASPVNSRETLLSKKRESFCSLREYNYASSSGNSSESSREIPVKTDVVCQCPSTRSLRPGSATSLDKADAIFQEWLDKKKQKQRELKLLEAKAREVQAKQRELALNMERDNFKKWLAQKKAEEERIRREKELLMEEEKRKQEEDEIRAQTNKLRYQLWLKEKEKQELEKKLENEITVTRKRIAQQRRQQDAQKAFDDWLKNSKNKPKPIPLNQGLASLKSSVSVTYINPTPWHPNIEDSTKPTSA